MQFRFIEFNQRRAIRGAPAARVEVSVHGDGFNDWLWMSKVDIRKNIQFYGECSELRKALDAYGKGGVK